MEEGYSERITRRETETDVIDMERTTEISMKTREEQKTRTKLSIEVHKKRQNKKIKKDTGYASTPSIGHIQEIEDDVFQPNQVTRSPIKTPTRNILDDTTLPIVPIWDQTTLPIEHSPGASISEMPSCPQYQLIRNPV